MKIIDLTPEDDRAVEQTAMLLVEGFRDTGSTDWTTLEDGLAEVRESFHPGRISRVAVDQEGNVQGWIGGIESYNGNVWELHPLVVREDCRGRGVGRALVLDLEAQVAQRGAWTIQLGTDDENARTSVGGVDLYPDVLEKLRSIENLRRHPFEFYQKLGYEIVGLIPDASGFGKPDIWMAKRVKKPEERA
ncbi:MAG: GNAT family N-acetyltransferase [Blastocatellia bacterium]